MPSGTFSAPAGYRDSPARPLSAGEVVASAYAIRDELGRTDTGIVFDARDMVLDRPVALKLAWRDPGTPALIAEARRCASVRDACAVQVHGMGIHNGVEFVVGERVAGHLLREELIKPLTEELYLTRLRTLIAAVTRAHDGGIAVGDISGSTVLVDTGATANSTGSGDRLIRLRRQRAGVRSQPATPRQALAQRAVLCFEPVRSPHARWPVVPAMTRASRARLPGAPPA